MTYLASFPHKVEHCRSKIAQWACPKKVKNWAFQNLNCVSSKSPKKILVNFFGS